MRQRRLVSAKQGKARGFGQTGSASDRAWSAFGHAGAAFGGSHLQNSHAKTERPFSPRAAIHTVLRARAPFTLLKRGRRARIEGLVKALARRHRVHVHHFANVGNHLHLLLECREKSGFVSFLRTLSGAIARFIKLEEKSETGSASLWLQRPWTSLLPRRGQAFLTAWRYVDLNDIEGSYWGVTRAEARRIQAQELE